MKKDTKFLNEIEQENFVLWCSLTIPNVEVKGYKHHTCAINQCVGHLLEFDQSIRSLLIFRDDYCLIIRSMLIFRYDDCLIIFLFD